MKNKRQNIKESLKLTTLGFTLVELLAVIVILAIILVIAVPKVMDVINDAKKATLESTAKMIASAAEKAKVQNTVLGKNDTITCESVAKINNLDYEDCDIDFDDNTAKVTIKGSGKFAGLYVCSGTKTNAQATNEGCALVCKKDEILQETVNTVKPYQVNYDACIDYLGPIILSDGGTEKDVTWVCKNEILIVYSFEHFVSNLIADGYFTKEELINNNIVSSSSVWEQNITLGNYDSCISYMKPKIIDEWGKSQDELESLCSGNITWDGTFSQNIQDVIDYGYFTKEELLENNVIGSDSVFANIKPVNQTTCVNNLKDIWVNDWQEARSDLQTLCKGDSLIYTTMDDFIERELASENDLIENDVIKTNITKTCIPSNSAVPYITKLYAESAKINGLIEDDTEDKNIRYVGENPNNYVYFNCEDTYDGESYGSEDYNYDDACEIWRIIGIFEVEKAIGGTEKLVKIVRDPFTDASGDALHMPWDSSAKDINVGYGINQWGESTYIDSNGDEQIYAGSDLMQMLNGHYLGKSSTCNYCVNGESCENDCSSYITPINNTYQNMIENVVWITRGIENGDYTAKEMYDAEKTSELTGKECNATNTDGSANRSCNDTVERNIEWEGKIGLIYPSDWGYASTDEYCSNLNNSYGSCNQSNWLADNEFYSISPFAEDYSAASVWAFTNYAEGRMAYNYTFSVRPSLYLKSSVQIIGGDGKSMPFKLAS